MAKLSSIDSRTLGAFSIWAIGVGLVISGESFGWNNGWRYMGITGFMLPVAMVAVLYLALVRCNIELACVYPNAEGPNVYSGLAFGKNVGRFVAFATLVEFLFASPAIANTIGEYIHFLSPDSINAKWIATLFIVLFCIVNLFKVQISTVFIILLTVLAIVELNIYLFSVQSSFDIQHITQHVISDNYSLSAIVSAVPFAIWLFLGIEGISLVTKNVQSGNFRKHISKGYYLAFFTLLALVIAVLVMAGGSSHWTTEQWQLMVSDTNGHPLPLSMEFALGKTHYLVQIFTFLGLFGLIASLQGIVLASMQQIQALFKVNNSQLISSGVVVGFSLLSIWGQTTSFLIELSVFGAVCMYLFNGLSLIQLRKNNPEHPELKALDIQYHHSDFNKASTYLSSGIVVLLSAFCASSLIYLHVWYFLAFCAISVLYILLAKRFNF